MGVVSQVSILDVVHTPFIVVIYHDSIINTGSCTYITCGGDFTSVNTGIGIFTTFGTCGNTGIGIYTTLAHV